MIQFNLLPDVKLQFIQAQRLKRLIIAVSILVSGVSLIIFLLLFLFVDVGQTKHLNDINSDITTDSAQLGKNPNLNKILTVQNQLTTLPTIESQSPVVSRLFGYMTQVTPVNATISSLSADFTQHLLTINGAADTLATVNQFVDTLKFTTYKAPGVTSGQAFSNVVLSSFGYGGQSIVDGKPASYTVTLTFDPTIFSNESGVSLNVPSKTTTRSVLNQPDLFQAGTTTTTGKGK